MQHTHTHTHTHTQTQTQTQQTRQRGKKRCHLVGSAASAPLPISRIWQRCFVTQAAVVVAAAIVQVQNEH
jgi:hypothetical protein